MRAAVPAPRPGLRPVAASRTRSPRKCFGRAVKVLHEAGVTQQGDIDCIVAMVGGLMEAQMSNDPGGNRWTRHLNRLVDLYVDDALTRSKRR